MMYIHVVAGNVLLHGHTQYHIPRECNKQCGGLLGINMLILVCLSLHGEASFQESKLNINRDSLAHCPHIYLCTYVVYCTPTSPGIPSDQLAG